MNDTAHRARGCDTGEEYYALCARALEPSWSDQLVAALLGLHLREEEEGHLPGGGGGGGGGDGVGEDVRVRGALREDECRVARSAGCGGEGEATVEVASREALEFALMRDGALPTSSHFYTLGFADGVGGVLT
jgi:hypothetical protein